MDPQSIPVDGLNPGQVYRVTNIYGVVYQGTFARLELCRSSKGGILLVVIKKAGASRAFWRLPVRHIQWIERLSS